MTATAYRPRPAGRHPGDRAFCQWARIETLEEENRQLREQLATAAGREWDARARQAFGLSGDEARVLCLIVKRGIVSHEALIGELWPGRSMPADPGTAVRKCVSKCRLRLPPGTSIRSIYGVGYCMDEAGRAICWKMLE